MNQGSIRAEGRLSLHEGEGVGEGLAKTAAEIEPLTFVLSPSKGERREKASILLVEK